MALTAYMKLKGKSQGDIKGDCEQGGDKKDSILVYGAQGRDPEGYAHRTADGAEDPPPL